MKAMLITLAAMGGFLLAIEAQAQFAPPERGGCRTVYVNGRRTVICPQPPGPTQLPNPPVRPKRPTVI